MALNDVLRKQPLRRMRPGWVTSRGDLVRTCVDGYLGMVKWQKGDANEREEGNVRWGKRGVS